MCERRKRKKTRFRRRRRPTTGEEIWHGATACIFMRNLPESAVGKFPGGPNVSQQASYYHVVRDPWQHLFISQLTSWIVAVLGLGARGPPNVTRRHSQTTAAAERKEHKDPTRLLGRRSGGRRRALLLLSPGQNALIIISHSPFPHLVT